MNRSQVEIDALKSDAFALPIHRHFPIEDQEDVDFAAEHIKECIDPAMAKKGVLELCKKLQLQVPAQWENAKMSQVVKFGEIAGNAILRGDGRYERKGKFFECDKVFTDMNGKNFMLPSDKAPEMLPLFKPCNVNFQHDENLECLLTLLFGDERPKTEKLEMSGKDIIATWSTPAWFHEATQGRPIPVSSEWVVDSFLPVGCAYVTDPAVSDAIMMSAPVKAKFAAFKKFDTEERDKLAKSGAALPDGSFPITDSEDVKNAVHDFGRAGSKPDVKAHIISRAKSLGCMDALPADWGGKAMMLHAIPDDNAGQREKWLKDNPGMDFPNDSLKGLSPSIQRHHDSLVDEGAECPGKSMFSAEEKLTWDTARTILMMSPSHLKAIQKMHDACPPGHCTHYATMRKGYMHRYSKSAASADNKGKTMNPYERLVAFFKGKGASDAEADTQAKEAAAALIPHVEVPATVQPVNFSESTEYKAIMSRLNAQQDENTALKTNLETVKLQLDTKSETIAMLAKSKEEDAATAKFQSDVAEVTTLARTGKINPAEVKTYTTLAKDHPAAFAAVLADLQARPVMVQYADLTKTVRMAGMPNDNPADEIASLTKARMQEKNESYIVAFKAICAENPHLSTASFAAMKSYSGGGNN